MYSDILNKIEETPLSHKEIPEGLGQKQVSGQLNKILSKLVEDKLIEHTVPDNKNHLSRMIMINFSWNFDFGRKVKSGNR